MMIESGRVPELALVVTVEEIFFHCTKCMVRSLMWQPETWNASGLTSIGEAMVVHGKFDLSVAEMMAIAENDEKSPRTSCAQRACQQKGRCRASAANASQKRNEDGNPFACRVHPRDTHLRPAGLDGCRQRLCDYVCDAGGGLQLYSVLRTAAARL